MTTLSKEKLAELRHLDLMECTQISDAGLIAIAEKCPKLQHLDLGHAKINNDGLRALAEKCPNLQYLYLNGCTRLTVDCIWKLKESYPKLDIIWF